jgi:mannose-1-phosphate guanylyltransferase/phosphomannomutase
MAAATEADVVMATDGGGNFSFPGLYPGIDGLFAVGKLLELLAQQRTTLSQVIADLPPFHIATGHVDGAWESKGRVMRCLIEQFSKLRHETIDGIKVHLGDHEWVLIRPDNDTPQFHLTAEARSLPSAQELVADYGGLVRRYIQEPCSSGEPTNSRSEGWG